MAGDFFLWALAGATAAAAIALVVLLVRRTRPARIEPPRLARGRGGRAEAGLARTEPGDQSPDDWGDPRADDDPDLAKICPACGLRYGLASRTCARDNSELAAIH